MLEGWGIIKPTDRNEVAKRGLMVARVLVDAAAEKYPVPVFNPGITVVVISGGGVLGTISSTDPENIQKDERSTIMMMEREEETIENKVQPAVPEHLTTLYQRSIENFQEDPEREKVKKLLIDYQDVFSTCMGDLGKTDLVRHEIRTGDTTPIRQRPR